MATATTAQLAITLTDLRRRVADRLGDYTQLVCTSNSLNSFSIIDVINVNAGAENFNGRVLLFASGTAGNIGRIRRVTSTTDSTNTIAYTPLTPSLPVANDVVDAFNKRGIGFQPREYTNAINQAINDAFPLGVIDLQASPTAFDENTPEITVPANMIDVYDVEWQDVDGDWHRVLKANRNNEYGWRVDQPNGQIRILGTPGWQASSSNIRISGYGRQDVLTAETDTCLLNAEYVVARACYHLCAGSLMRDSAYGQLTPMYQQESERMRTRIRTIRRPNTERVRSV